MKRTTFRPTVKGHDTLVYMASKTAKELAYDAGRTAFENEPADRRSLEACPFSPIDHPDERQAWLEGFSDALEEQPDLTSLRKELKAARDDS